MNTLGSLLVHVDASARAEVRLALALQLADRCNTGAQAPGSIEAVYCTTPSFADLPLAFAAAPAFLKALYDERHADARQRFDRVKLGAGERMRWREVGGEAVVAAVSGRAMFADLLLLGQHAPDDLGTLSTPADFVQAVLIESGKPAIVVPHLGSFKDIGREVLIAWKPSRESARAVSAAMPLLQRASRIHLAVESGSEAGAGDLEAHLRANGVEAKVQRHGALGSAAAGDSLLSLAAYAGADLLVMGCYGHSRARELLLGGATRTVLRSMTLPVLMAH